VKVNGRLREFNFRKLKSPDDLFTVNVCNDRGDRIIFGMKKNNNNWEIQAAETKLPDWITQGEGELGYAIDDELQQNW
jgi:hypothetical protein